MEQDIMQANKLALSPSPPANGTVVYGVEDAMIPATKTYCSVSMPTPMKPFKTRTVRS